MDYYMVLGKDLKEKNIIDIVELDKIAYEQKHLITLESEMDRFEKNKDIYICLYSKEHQLVGYASMFPITDDLYNKVKQGIIEKDEYIAVEDILEYKSDGSMFNLYLSSIVTHPNHSGIRIMMQLIKGMIIQLDKLTDRGIAFGNILAFLVPHNKGKIEKLLGFKKVAHTTNGMPVIEGKIYQLIRYNNRTGKFAAV